MKKFFIIFLPFITCFCTRHNADIISADSQAFSLGISRESITLSEDDALQVALQFNNKKETKTVKRVKNVIPFRQSSDSTLLYVVNFNEGCTVVSATKKFLPILANIEKGNIEGITNTGVDIFLQQYMDKITLVLSSKDAPVLKKEWSKYEKHCSEIIPKTKVNDDYYELLDEFLDDMYDSGFEFRHLDNPFEDMPENVYNNFCNHAEDTDYIGYNYWDCALIGRKEYSSSQTIPPLLSSTWGQEYPYNYGSSYSLGCATIAAGQIMRCHQYPSSFYWAGMPDSIVNYNPYLCGFLQTLRSAIGVDANGGATIQQVKNALQGYGYTCSIQSHNPSVFKNLLENSKPIYCRGKNVNTNIGHAWVCDGYYDYQTHTIFVLYTLAFYNGAAVQFELNDSYSSDYYSSPLFHINWGQHGYYNGNFYDGYLCFTNGSNEQRNYSSNDRQELIISKPAI